MGRMKEVFQIKQDLIAIDKSYMDKPDSYFIDLYLSMRRCEDRGQEKPESKDLPNSNTNEKNNN